MFQPLRTPQIRLLASTGLLCSALLASTVGSAFAAPMSMDPASVSAESASAVQLSSQSFQGSNLDLLNGSLVAVANLFGITPTTLEAQLEAGQTLAQLAPQYNSSATLVQSTILGAVTANVTQELASGQVTQDQATAILNAAPARISQLVNTNLVKEVKVLASHPVADFIVKHPVLTAIAVDHHANTHHITNASERHQSRS